jgi:hypothetical protein
MFSTSARVAPNVIRSKFCQVIRDAGSVRGDNTNAPTATSAASPTTNATSFRLAIATPGVI